VAFASPSSAGCIDEASARGTAADASSQPLSSDLCREIIEIESGDDGQGSYLAAERIAEEFNKASFAAAAAAAATAGDAGNDVTSEDAGAPRAKRWRLKE
jgi:hypothetical protein